MDHQPTIAVDLDGTILSYDGWVSEETFGPPLPGARAALLELVDAGWRVIVHTCRLRSELVEAHLQRHQIPFHQVWTREDVAISRRPKPIADVYLDDRGLRFDGDWSGMVEAVLSFRSWVEK